VGDPEKVVDGVQTYRITYTVQGPFLFFDTQDELYWNVTGVWANGIAEASVLFDLPEGAKVLKASCFQGKKGEGRECDESEQLVSEGRAGFLARARALDVGEGFAVAVLFPKGVIAQPKKSWEGDDSFGAGVMEMLTDPRIAYGSFVVPFALVLYLVFVWYTRMRPLHMGARIPRGALPPELTPSIAGIVFDERIEPRHVVAEVVRLAVDGYLTIRAHEKKGHEGTPEYALVRTKKDVAEHDTVAQSVLRTLFPADSEEGQTVSHAQLRAHLVEWYDVIAQDLYAEVLTRGYFITSPTQVRKRFFMVGVVVASLGGLAFFASPAVPLILAVSGVVSGCILLLLGMRFPARTALGARLAGELKRYKDLLSSPESDLFKDETADFSETVYTHLAYGLVFSLEGAWEAHYKDQSIGKPSWYAVVGGTEEDASLVRRIVKFSEACREMCLQTTAHGAQ
jgi:FtsH-binding integral membrane protein